MPKPTDYDKTHLRNMAAIGTRIDRIFKKAAEEAAMIGVSIKAPLPDDRIFSFDDYPATQKQIKRLMTALQQSMEITIVNGVRSSWTLSNNKNNALVSRIFGDRVGDLSKEQYKRYFSTNGAALEAFLQRKQQGLSLSDRVWRYTNAFKHEIEMGLDLGIRSGESAAKMTRSLRQYLQHPDKLFRRVRDQHGNLKLSKAAAEFHPGRGVYRSSYKNARRLAATETNIAYRTSDYLRWQQMDFVVGIEIKLSNNHTLNGVPLTDICDTLAGLYPKDFKFTGWHPHCRCKAIAILKTEDEMTEDTDRILDGRQPTKGSVNTVRDVPDAFRTWIEERKDRIEMGGNLPYFIKDNAGIIEQAMGKPGFLTTITVGKNKFNIATLIEESTLIPTKQGKVYLHPAHGKTEKSENLDFAKWRAEQFGEEVILIPNPQGAKSPDSYNITRRVQEEYKRSKESNSLNAMDRLLRDGAKQADYLIIEPKLMPIGNLEEALKDRVKRCKDLKEIRIKIGNYEALYTREQIISNGYKIQPEDFRNASISRRRGSNPEGIEPGHITMVDAKVANFFGLNKKSVKEIAAARHVKRDAAAIQKAWNERRISAIKASVSKGLLPKESLMGWSSLPQEQFNNRIAFLQKRAAKHAARTPQNIRTIKDAWAAKQQRDANTKLIAGNVLKVAHDWREVDFSVLEKIIANNNLNKMREEAKKVAKAVKAMRVEEKALSDLIPDVHEWHKQFSIAELKTVKASIEKQLANFKVKGYGDFALDTDIANLQTLKNSLVYQAKLAIKNQAKYATWEVAQKSWLKLADKAQDLIDLQPLKVQYNALLGFKTTSKDFKFYMDKAKDALAVGDVKAAKNFVTVASNKKSHLEAKRKGKTRGSGFDNDAYSQARKDAAMWAKTTKTADKQLRAKCGEVWRNATDAQRDAIYGYTQSYHNINEPLRGLTYVGSAAKTKEGLMRIPHIEAIIDKSTYDFDMWLQRGDGMIALKKFGLSNWQTATEADIMKLVGAEGVEGAFWSAGVAKGKGFSGNIIFNIYAPKGTKAMYCEPFSAFGHGSGRSWDGIAEQSSFGHESEILIQRGTKFRITKIERSGGTYYIDVEIIEQQPVPFPYVEGYPFK